MGDDSSLLLGRESPNSITRRKKKKGKQIKLNPLSTGGGSPPSMYLGQLLLKLLSLLDLPVTVGLAETVERLSGRNVLPVE
jgi:hypothetical protein